MAETPVRNAGTFYESPTADGKGTWIMLSYTKGPKADIRASDGSPLQWAQLVPNAGQEEDFYRKIVGDIDKLKEQGSAT